MLIEAVYDFLCRWWLIAKRELALALEQEGDHGVGISWRQFLLAPEFDRLGHDSPAQSRTFPAAAHGCEEGAALAHLESDCDLAEPFAETEKWRRRSVTSMPHFRVHFSDWHTEILTTTLADAFANAPRRDREFVSLAATGS